jgi:uncharacterized membrane protein YgcG
MPSPDLPPGKVLEYRGFGQKRPPREACRVELRDDPARIVVVTARGGELVSRFEPSSVTITTGERRVAPSPPFVASGGIIATLIIAVFWLVVDVLLAIFVRRRYATITISSGSRSGSGSGSASGSGSGSGSDAAAGGGDGQSSQVLVLGFRKLSGEELGERLATAGIASAPSRA